MKKIKLTQGQVTFVSDKDYCYLTKWKWYTCKRKQKGKFEARRSVYKGDYKYTSVSIHRVIAKRMGLNLSCDIDHKDRNPLNNQRSNLRSATRFETTRNSTKASNKTSKFKGVSLFKRVNKWTAYIRVNYKKKHLGYFVSEIEAAKAYNKAAKKYHGKFASLNSIPKKGK